MPYPPYPTLTSKDARQLGLEVCPACDAAMHCWSCGSISVAQKPATIEEQLRAMKPEDRLDAISGFCRFCGDENPRCHCMNDE